MNNPIISIIIPTFDSEKLIFRAIKSVLNQTLQDFELIIVDDGSTDNTKEIIDDFQKKDNRIFYHRLDENSGGAAKPKNVGIKISRGKYIATLDSDDEWYPKKLEKQLKLFETSKVSNLGFVGCFAKHILESEKLSFSYKIPRYDNLLYNILSHDYMGSGSGIMYKKEVFNKVGYFDEKLRTGQDAEMRIRLAQFYNFDFVEEELFIYYFHKKNISNTLSIKERMEDINYIINKWKNLYNNYPKAYSNRLRFNGTSYMLVGEKKLARLSFAKSIGKNPLNYKSYLYLFLSFFGSRFYKKLALLKAKYVHI